MEGLDADYLLISRMLIMVMIFMFNGGDVCRNKLGGQKMEKDIGFGCQGPANKQRSANDDDVLFVM